MVFRVAPSTGVTDLSARYGQRGERRRERRGEQSREQSGAALVAGVLALAYVSFSSVPTRAETDNAQSGRAQSGRAQSHQLEPGRAQPSHRSCSPEMVRVGGFCIDRWEIATVDRDTREPLSPYYPPHPRL